MDYVETIPLFGSMVNAATIVIGGAAGLGLRRWIPAKILDLPMQGIFLLVAALGVSMAIKTDNILIQVAAIAAGSVVGELLDIEGWLTKGTQRLEACLSNSGNGLSTGFVAATILYCTGSMGVLGSFEEGLGGYPFLLLTKAMLDGLTSIALAASLGFGVLLSAISIFIYQGALTLAASTVQPLMTEVAVREMTSCGGLMLIAISLNMLKLTNIRVTNMLPALPAAVLLAKFFMQ